MITGYLLIGTGKSSNIFDFYKKRFGRIAIPFVFWSIAYFLWRIYVRGGQTDAGLLFGKGTYYHLWFLYALAGLYAAAPFIDRMLCRLSIADMLWFLGAWFIGASLVPWIEWGAGTRVMIPLRWFSSYFGYLVLGALIRKLDLLEAGVVRLGLILGGVFLLTFAGTVWLSIRDNGRINESLLVYLAPNIVVISVIGFALLSNWSCFKSQTVKGLIQFLSKCSLGIYLCHVMVMEILSRWIFLNHVDIIGLLLLFAGTVSLSMGVVYAGLRIPLLKYAFS